MNKLQDPKSPPQPAVSVEQHIQDALDRLLGKWTFMGRVTAGDLRLAVAAGYEEGLRAAPPADGVLREAEVIERLEIWRKEGAAAFDAKAVNPHKTNSLAGYMHAWGWVIRDLRLALDKVKAPTAPIGEAGDYNEQCAAVHDAIMWGQNEPILRRLNARHVLNVALAHPATIRERGEGVLQADREAAKLLRQETVRRLGPRSNLDNIEDDDFDVRLFAAHRLAAAPKVESGDQQARNLMEIARQRNAALEALDGINSLTGNVDHSRGGGSNTARMYGEMLNDIRTIAREALGFRPADGREMGA